MNMNHWLVHERFYFLRDLGNQTKKSDRFGIIHLMNSGMMKALQKVVECILYGWIPIRRLDYREFKHHVDALRQIVTSGISLVRKKETLKNLHKLLPRLLRERYLHRVVHYERVQNRRRAES